MLKEESQKEKEPHNSYSHLKIFFKVSGRKGEGTISKSRMFVFMAKEIFNTILEYKISVNERPAEETEALWVISQHPTQEKYLLL